MSVETPEEPAMEPRRKAPRWMKIVLVLSLMLNVVAIGAVGARAWMVHKHGPGGFAMHALGIHSFLRQLPSERRDKLRGQFKEARKSLRGQRHQFVTPLKELANALSAPQFDQARLNAAVMALRMTHDSHASGRQDLLLKFVDALTPDERKILGSKILRRVEKMEKWHKRFSD